MRLTKKEDKERTLKHKGDVKGKNELMQLSIKEACQK